MDVKEFGAIIGLIVTFISGIAWGVKKYFKLKKIWDVLNSKVDEISKSQDRIQVLEYLSLFIQSKLDSAIKLLHKPMFICSEEGLCTLANEALCTLYGASSESMLGMGWTNYIHIEDRDGAWRLWETSISRGVADIKSSYRVVNGITGEIFSITYHAIIIRDEDNKIIVCVGNVTK